MMAISVCRAEQVGESARPARLHLQLIAVQGRMAWQRESGTGIRARAEERRSGGSGASTRERGLRSHTNERRATEVGVAVQVLNRMLELGRPTYVRIA
jgi:hypothetical protein